MANYARALQFVDYLSDTLDTAIPIISEGTILQIHWHLMSGIHDTHLLPGKYRTGPNWIEDQRVKVYEPSSHIDVPMLMREFSEWIIAKEQLSPVIKAGIAHLHLVAIHPFVDGNGRTARLLATLLLQRYGYGFRKLLSLDTYYQRNRDEYINALRNSLGKTFNPEYESSTWLEFFTRSILLQAGLLEERLTDWRIEVEKIHETLKKTGLNDRQIDGLILWAGALDEYVTQKELEDFCKRYHPLPIICAERTIDDIPSIHMNNYQSMREIIVHLIEGHGYRRIAFIRGPEGHLGLQERYRAYTETLADYDLPLDPNLVRFGYRENLGVDEVATWLLDEQEAAVEAVVGHNDSVALCALRALQSRGKRVPQDVAVVGFGFDDNAEIRAITPSLTTVNPLLYEMGQKAVEMLLTWIDGEELPERVTADYPPPGPGNICRRIRRIPTRQRSRR